MSFSKPYDHNVTTGHIKQTKDETPDQEICWTSFEIEQVRDFLNTWNNADEFRVGSKNVNGQDYFTLDAYENGAFKDKIVGKFPCPNQCIPPDLINHSFDRRHVEDVTRVPGCEYVNVHKCKLRISTSFSLFCMYAVIKVNEIYVSKDQPGDFIYVTET